jgi:hypothetical protein
MNRRGLRTQKLIAIFLLGALLLNYPLLGLVGDERATRLIGGIPALYVYLFVVWSVLIGLMAGVIERRAK